VSPSSAAFELTYGSSPRRPRSPDHADPTENLQHRDLIRLRLRLLRTAPPHLAAPAWYPRISHWRICTTCCNWPWAGPTLTCTSFLFRGKRYGSTSPDRRCDGGDRRAQSTAQSITVPRVGAKNRFIPTTSATVGNHGIVLEKGLPVENQTWPIRCASGGPEALAPPEELRGPRRVSINLLGGVTESRVTPQRGRTS